MSKCLFCSEPVKAPRRKFCSVSCAGMSRRGSGDSYVRIRVDGGRRVYFHRFVFEQTIRPLEPGEIVHHKDENPKNNDPENLEALPWYEHERRHGHFGRGRRRARVNHCYTEEILDEDFPF